MNYFDVDSNFVDVIKTVLQASLRSSFEHLNHHPEGCFRYRIAKFLGKRKEITANYPKGFLYWGLSEYLLKKDRELLPTLSNKLCIFFNQDDCLNYNVTIVDQVPMGCCFINMYHLTNEEKYKKAAYEYACYLVDRFNKDRILYRSNTNVQLVDTLGMVVPFLCMFSELTRDIKYLNIAKEIYYDFVKHAYTSSGFLVHGYEIDTGIHLGSSNWGRGFGWYLLAKGYLHESDELTNSLLSKISYVQFPFQGFSIKDSSVAFLCELYKVLHNPHYTPQLNLLYPFIREDGSVDFCTGDTCGFNSYSSYYGLGGLSNGLFLLLLSNLSK